MEMEGACDVEVVVVMEEVTTEVVAVAVVEVGLVKMEVEMGLFKNLVLFALRFSYISAWFLVSRIRRFLLENDYIYIYIYIYRLMIK